MNNKTNFKLKNVDETAVNFRFQGFTLTLAFLAVAPNTGRREKMTVILPVSADGLSTWGYDAALQVAGLIQFVIKSADGQIVAEIAKESRCTGCPRCCFV